MSKKTRELMDVIRDGVEAVFTSQEYIEYLNFISKFPHYSPNNIMLIYRQKPDASFDASYSAWQKMGGAVKRGSHAIRIIAPHTTEDEDGKLQLGFHAASVFDISSVYGVEVPDPVKLLDGVVND
ncbi:MAG: ssDNA-binding domain-containing protein [Lachnospiraceae bacterium]|nr:ssDNA-binding domain-containing protein [Lachnospiraceae bacterium]